MKTSLTKSPFAPYHRTVAGFLDGLIIRLYHYIAQRQRGIQPRLPKLPASNNPIAPHYLRAENIFPAPPSLTREHLRWAPWEQQGRFWRRDYVFPSSVPLEDEQNRLAFVQTFANDRGLHFPAVIVLHGLMSQTLIVYRPFFRKIVDAGALAYAMELPYHLRRTPRQHVSGELFHTADLEKSWMAIQQAVADTRQWIYFLREAGAPMIGLLGFSLGAWIAALVASCEPEVDFALLALLPSGINDLLWQARTGEPLRRKFQSVGWNSTITAPLYRLLDPLNFPPLIPLERVELFAAEFDHFVPLQQMQILHEAWQKPRLQIYSRGHISLVLSRKFKNDLRQRLMHQLALGKRAEAKVTVVGEETLQIYPQNSLEIGASATGEKHTP